MCNVKELTTKQREVIEYMAEHLGANYTAVCEATGVHRNTFLKWRKQTQFQDALDYELHRIFKEGASTALKTMMDLAKDGDRQAAQYILDNVGFKQADKVELTTSDIKITIN